MLEKSITIIALAGLASGAAFAGGVTLHGAVDAGLEYTHVSNHDGHQNTFKAVDGLDTANRIGIRGSESLGNGLEAGFVLENGFNLMNGAMNDGDAGDTSRFFGREALLFMSSPAGTFAVGRQGAISSGFGTFGRFGDEVSVLGDGRGAVPGLKSVVGMTAQRLDNAFTYESPSFGGVNLLGQYAAKTQDRHGWFDSPNERFIALGATYKGSGVYGSAIVDSLMRPDGKPDGHKLSLGGHVALGDATVYAATQFWKDLDLNVPAISNTAMRPVDLKSGGDNPFTKGFGMNLGASYKLGRGAIKGDFGYAHASQLNADTRLNRFIASAGYDYPLSRRTTVYADGGVMFDRYSKPADGDKNANTLSVNVGMAHKF